MASPAFEASVHQPSVTDCSWQGSKDGDETFKVAGRAPPSGYALCLTITDTELTEHLTKTSPTKARPLTGDVEELIDTIMSTHPEFLCTPHVERKTMFVFKSWQMLFCSVAIDMDEKYGCRNLFLANVREDSSGTQGEHSKPCDQHKDVANRILAATGQLDVLIENCMDAIVQEGENNPQETAQEDREGLVDPPSETSLRCLHLGQDLRDRLEKIKAECRDKAAKR